MSQLKCSHCGAATKAISYRVRTISFYGDQGNPGACVAVECPACGGSFYFHPPTPSHVSLLEKQFALDAGEYGGLLFVAAGLVTPLAECADVEHMYVLPAPGAAEKARQS